jgi:NADPH:quinone reductase-like Zn-dependent oxidoreductase
MKAIVFTKYGPPDVLQLKEVEKPVPKDKEILIKIYATPISFGDTLVRNLKEISPRKFHMPFLFWLFAKIYFGFRKSRITILGSEFAGEIESSDSGKATRFSDIAVHAWGLTPSISACLKMGWWQ